jgi:hypothetical protein
MKQRFRDETLSEPSYFPISFVSFDKINMHVLIYLVYGKILHLFNNTANFHRRNARICSIRRLGILGFSISSCLT